MGKTNFNASKLNMKQIGDIPNDAFIQIFDRKSNKPFTARIDQLIVSGGGTGLINIEYADLYNKVVNGELTPGQWYRLTDYKSVNFLNGWQIANNNPTPVDPNFNPQEIYEGETEVLLLQATSPYEIAEIGYSETFQGDIVQYQPYTNKIGVDIGGIYNGQTLPDSSTVSGFDLQWDGTNVYFDMPAGYPALFGHYFYLYCEFEDLSSIDTVTLSGSSTGPDQIYIVSGTNISGNGTGAIFDIKVALGVYSLNLIINSGSGYQIGDQILILGSQLGGVDGLDDLTITVDTLTSSYYYQDGNFEPLTPGVSICQYPYTSDDPDYGYPKAMSRIKVVNNGTRVLLLDLTQADVTNYQPDTLYVDTVYAIEDSYGWITKRQDTLRNITAPLDFRGRKYRRFEVDLSSVNAALGTGYYGQGDNYLSQGTTGNYKDFKVFGNDGYDYFNIEWNDMGGADLNWYCGYNDNVVCLGSFYNNTFGNNFFNNTIGNNFFYNTIGDGFYSNTIGGNFYNNNIGINFQSNTIGFSFNTNTIGDSFGGNTIGNSFQTNTIGNSFGINTIGDGFELNIIGNSFQGNTIGNDFVSNTTKYPVLSTDFSLATHVYGTYNCEIFNRSDNTLQLSYIDGTNTIQYAAINA